MHAFNWLDQRRTLLLVLYKPKNAEAWASLKDIFRVCAQWATYFGMKGVTSWNIVSSSLNKTMMEIMQVTTYSKYQSCKCFMREMHLDIICLTQFSRVSYSECNNKRLQIPYYKQDQKPRSSDRWPYKILVTFPCERFLFFFARVKSDKQMHKCLHMFQPSDAPVLICYLASSWLVIFCPQVEPST